MKDENYISITSVHAYMSSNQYEKKYYLNISQRRLLSRTRSTLQGWGHCAMSRVVVPLEDTGILHRSHWVKPRREIFLVLEQPTCKLSYLLLEQKERSNTCKRVKKREFNITDKIFGGNVRTHPLNGQRHGLSSNPDDPLEPQHLLPLLWFCTQQRNLSIIHPKNRWSIRTHIE